MTAIVLLSLPLALTSCASARLTYFNDSDKIYSEAAGKGACANVNFDCVVMSKGQFRNLTGVDVELGKSFSVTYK